jgi:hypothetical protein
VLYDGTTNMALAAFAVESSPPSIPVGAWTVYVDGPDEPPVWASASGQPEPQNAALAGALLRHLERAGLYDVGWNCEDTPEDGFGVRCVAATAPHGGNVATVVRCVDFKPSPPAIIQSTRSWETRVGWDGGEGLGRFNTFGEAVVRVAEGVLKHGVETGLLTEYPNRVKVPRPRLESGADAVEIDAEAVRRAGEALEWVKD